MKLWDNQEVLYRGAIHLAPERQKAKRALWWPTVKAIAFIGWFVAAGGLLIYLAVFKQNLP